MIHGLRKLRGNGELSIETSTSGSTKHYPGSEITLTDRGWRAQGGDPFNSSTTHVASDTITKINGSIGTDTMKTVLNTASFLAGLSSLFFNVMWGSLIVAGVQGLKAGYNAHKANVMRREEILQQLMAAKKQE